MVSTCTAPSLRCRTGRRAGTGRARGPRLEAFEEGTRLWFQGLDEAPRAALGAAIEADETVAAEDRDDFLVMLGWIQLRGRGVLARARRNRLAAAIRRELRDRDLA